MQEMEWYSGKHKGWKEMTTNTNRRRLWDDEKPAG